jgi:hypothetical protein
MEELRRRILELTEQAQLLPSDSGKRAEIMNLLSDAQSKADSAEELVRRAAQVMSQPDVVDDGRRGGWEIIRS